MNNLVSHINLISKNEFDKLYESYPLNLAQMTLDDETDLYLLMSDKECLKDAKEITEDVKSFLSLQGIQPSKGSILFYTNKTKENENI